MLQTFCSFICLCFFSIFWVSARVAEFPMPTMDEGVPRLPTEGNAGELLGDEGGIQRGTEGARGRMIGHSFA